MLRVLQVFDPLETLLQLVNRVQQNMCESNQRRHLKQTDALRVHPLEVLSHLFDRVASQGFVAMILMNDSSIIAVLRACICSKA